MTNDKGNFGHCQNVVGVQLFTVVLSMPIRCNGASALWYRGVMTIDEQAELTYLRAENADLRAALAIALDRIAVLEGRIAELEQCPPPRPLV